MGPCCCWDLDNFKSINDSPATPAATRCSRPWWCASSPCPRKTWVLARTLGDEFALLFTALGQGYVTPRSWRSTSPGS